MRLYPRPIFGAAEPLARATPVALATRQVGPFDDTGMDGLTAGGNGEAMRHGFLRAADARGGSLHHAPPFPALDDLGLGPVSRWEERGCGLGSALARDVPENFR